MQIQKEDAIAYVREVARQKVLTKGEVTAAFDSGLAGKSAPVNVPKKFGITEVLYYIGGAIVFFGIAIFLAQNWFTLTLTTKLLASLGAGVAAYVVGWLFSRDERTESASSAFYLVSALITPVGLYALLDNMGMDFGVFGMQTIISGVMLSIFLLSLLAFRKNIFLLFSILFGTWLFFSSTSLMAGESAYLNTWEFYQYRIFGIGIVYLLLGYAFSKGSHASLRGFLYGFGSLGLLGAALSLSGFGPDQNNVWMLLYPGLVFGVLFLSVYLKSNALLVWGTIFLMLYILKLTAQYFSDSVGWPLALVITGLAIIGVGFMSITIKRKYLSK